MVQKCLPHLGHSQNCWGGHGSPGPGSRRSIWVPQRWQRIWMPTSLMGEILTLSQRCGRDRGPPYTACRISRSLAMIDVSDDWWDPASTGKSRGEGVGTVIPGIVLAAGASSRMGQPKALLPIDSGTPGRAETFLGHVVGTLRTAGVDDVLVVVGHDAELIGGVMLEMPNAPRLVYNPDAAQGQLSSILAALRVVDHPGVEAILLTLVDVPLVSAETVRRLLTAYRRTRAHIIRPARGDRHGHPVIFDRSVFDDLRQADPTIGAKAVLKAHAARVLDIVVDDEGAFADIDTPADYERIVGH